MNALDYILVAIGLFCLGRGLMRGAISQIFGIAGVLGGFIVASRYYEPLSVELSHSFPDLSGVHVISYIVLFFLTWFCIGVIGFLMARILHRTGLGFIDRFWGAAVGLGKALVLALILMATLTFFLPPKSPFLTDSIMAPQVQDTARFVIMATPKSVQDLFDEKQKELKRLVTDQKETPKDRSPVEKEVSARK
jgi:membrane protein required for colicin V production